MLTVFYQMNDVKKSVKELSRTLKLKTFIIEIFYVTFLFVLCDFLSYQLTEFTFSKNIINQFSKMYISKVLKSDSKVSVFYCFVSDYYISNFETFKF